MKLPLVVFSFALVWLLAPVAASAHCDTMGGPVIADARLALEKGDVTPVLKWVKPEHEAEVRTAFQKTLAVRSGTNEAREIADRYFFETLVRLHRAGEGAAYTGLKDEPLEPALALADQGLESGSADELIQLLQAEVVAGLRQRFNAAAEARRHANNSVAAGRAYVARYVEFVHYVERLHAASGETPAEGAASHAHAD
jgi:hypothetical protein